MDYSVLKRNALDKLKNNWSNYVVITLVYMLLVSAINGWGYMFNDSWFGYISNICYIIFAGPLAYGFASIFLKLSRGKKSEVPDLFEGFNNNFSNTIVAGVSIYFYTFLWSLLLIIPGIIAAYSYSFTYYIMQDNKNMSASEAIKESKRLTYGHKMELFVLDLTFIGWGLLAVLSCGIGFLWLIPYMETTKAEFYRKVVPDKAETDKDAETAETKVVDENGSEPFNHTSDAVVVHELKCTACGATKNSENSSETCPYCGGEMTENAGDKPEDK